MFKDETDFLNSAYIHREKLFFIALSRLKDENKANDAVIDVLLKAKDRYSQLKKRDKLLNWLVRILINYCNDIYRKEARFTSLDREFADTKEDVAERFKISQEIERILDALLAVEPTEQRDVVVLYFYRKFSYIEIAEMLGIAVGTVKSRLNRARPKLLEKLEEAGITKEELYLVKDMEGWPLL